MDNAPTYVAMGVKTTQAGPQTPSVRYFTDRNEAERQFYLYCAAACVSDNLVDTAILMTTEGFTLDTKTWKHEPQPEPTPEGGDEPEDVIPE